VRENLVVGSDPAEAGKTSALVQVPHRSLKPEQGTVGPSKRWKTRIKRYEDRYGAQDV